ncbi:hypothetical protein SDC9_163067 [bioreactor metagenome]|uniref:Uncharacterized protein n=1 Tax=bioreactor metagenome TaxID=1076179 RepID=A0A645FUE9_9ZZZZ
MVVDGSTEAVDARCQAACGASDAMLSDFREIFFQLATYGRYRRFARLGNLLEFIIKEFLQIRRTVEGRKGSAGRRLAERQGGTCSQGNGDRAAGIGYADNGRAMRTPDGQGHGFVDLFTQRFKNGARQAHGIQSPQSG